MKIISKTDKKEVERLFLEQKQQSIALKVEPLKARKQRLIRLQKWISANRELIHVSVFKDLKKPAQEVDLSEIYPVLTELRHTLSHLKEWAGKQPVQGSPTYLGTSAWIQSEPKGVCLIIAPWNYPFNLSVGPLVSALAAGNTVVLKPSEFTPHTSKLIREMIADLFEPEVCTVVEGDARMSGILTGLPFDHIFFTGSPAVGKRVMESAAKNLTSVTLELGGKSPAVVDETANVKDAAEKIAWGKWLNAGQTCVAPDYLYLHHSRYTEFIAALKHFSEKFYGQDETYTGIVNARHYQRLTDLLTDAQKANVEVVFGKKSNEEQHRIYPIVLTGVQNHMKVMQEEIFGPILPIIVYDELSVVVDYINSQPRPLALYLFTKSRRTRKKVLQQTSAGTVVINDCVLQFAHPTLPFGGTGNSGFGKAHGKAGFLAFSNEKSVLRQRVGYTMAKTVYPRYTPLKNWIIELMLKYF